MSQDPVFDAGDPLSTWRLEVVDDYRVLSVTAADLVTDVIAANPGCAITLPTGETPRGMYEELTDRIKAGALDFTSVHFFCLDDYLGKGIHDETSLTAWLDKAFLTPAGVHGGTVHFIPTLDENPDEAARRYEDDLQALGGLKLAVVGLGPNGHVGFNEPGSPIDSRTRVVNLTEESRDQNAAYYDGKGEIPSQAMTMGLGTILEAESIVVIVSGANKAEILREALERPITSQVPGSYLRTAGPRLTVIADRPAASKLSQ
jgi:glucosamine-6-phosphate deaminase